MTSCWLHIHLQRGIDQGIHCLDIQNDPYLSMLKKEETGSREEGSSCEDEGVCGDEAFLL